MERFQPIIGTGDAEVGAGGTVRFRVTDVEATCDVGVSILVGGEQAGAILPFGCRMGICHTCVGQAARRARSATCAPARCTASRAR